MKVTLPDALHARPASMLVRVANEFASTITIVKDARRANAKSILDVLGLGAAKGVEIEIEIAGADAEIATRTITTLIEANFSADLVPETGTVAVAGIAIGKTHVIAPPAEDASNAASEGASTSDDIDAAGAEKRFETAQRELAADIARLAPHERELLEPEIVIMKEVVNRVRTRMTEGARFREAVESETAQGMTDLFLDARSRLLGEAHAVTWESEEPTVLVAPSLPPSLVASLPAWVVGIVSAVSEGEARHGTGNTSHAAILARSRNIPLAFVDPSVTDAIPHGETAVLDTTGGTAGGPARVWIAPSATLLADATARRDSLAKAQEDAAARVAELAGKTSVIVRVNVSRRDEALPAHAHGVGLVRTELVFAANRTRPSRAEQAAAYRDIAVRAKGQPVSIRLFDAGGDKPLAWLSAPNSDVRGAALLFLHEAALVDQLHAIADAHSDTVVTRALIPLARSADDVKRTRALAPKGLVIGAMIETKEAVEHADEIAQAADFLSIGTNDLTASILGVARADASRGLEEPVLTAIERIIVAARAHGREVTVCGELAAHPDGAVRLAAAGVHALSVAIPAFSRVVEVLAREDRKESEP